MNGFANTILTILLSWLRALINNIWKLLGSEGGGSLYQFLAANWKTLVIILCVGGFVIDRIIYFIRWRPYYVWSSRLNRLRRRRAGEAYEDEAGPAGSPDEYAGGHTTEETPYAQPAPVPAAPAFAAPLQPQASAYMRPSGPHPTQAYNAFAPERVQPQPSAEPSFAPQRSAATQPINDFSQATLHYAPIAQNMPKDHTPYQQPYIPPADLEPVYDDDLDSWAEGETLVRPLSQSAWVNPAQGMENSFGKPRPEPLDYIRDMQAGFAPQPPPEQLYAPPAPPPVPEAPPKAPVHPGLDSEAFRQSFGLSPAGPLGSQPDDTATEAGGLPVQGAMHVPTFMPYAQPQDDSAGTKRSRSRNPFAGIAKKARDLVGVEDEDHRPTIHDLQSTVDMRTAFHEPVYPKSKSNESGDH